VTLLPAGSGRGVVIEITMPPPTTQPRQGNVYCRPVRVDRLSGTRCLDTIAGADRAELPTDRLSCRLGIVASAAKTGEFAAEGYYPSARPCSPSVDLAKSRVYPQLRDALPCLLFAFVELW
jgi:hypothetical protein